MTPLGQERRRRKRAATWAARSATVASSGRRRNQQRLRPSSLSARRRRRRFSNTRRSLTGGGLAIGGGVLVGLGREGSGFFFAFSFSNSLHRVCVRNFRIWVQYARFTRSGAYWHAFQNLTRRITILGVSFYFFFFHLFSLFIFFPGHLK